MPVVFAGVLEIHGRVGVLVAHGVPELFIVVEDQIRKRDAQRSRPPLRGTEGAELPHGAFGDFELDAPGVDPHQPVKAVILGPDLL